MRRFIAAVACALVLVATTGTVGAQSGAVSVEVDSGVIDGTRTTVVTLTNQTAIDLDFAVSFEGSPASVAMVNGIVQSATITATPVETVLVGGESSEIEVTQRQRDRFGDDGLGVLITFAPSTALPAGQVIRVPVPDRQQPTPELLALDATTLRGRSETIELPLDATTCADIDLDNANVGTLYANDQRLTVYATCATEDGSARAVLNFDGERADGRTYKGDATIGATKVSLSIGRGQWWPAVLALVFVGSIIGFITRHLLAHVLVRSSLERKVDRLGSDFRAAVDEKAATPAAAANNHPFVAAISHAQDSIRAGLGAAGWWRFEPAVTRMAQAKLAIAAAEARVGELDVLASLRQRVLSDADHHRFTGLTSYTAALASEGIIRSGNEQKGMVPDVAYPPARLSQVPMLHARCVEAVTIANRWPAAGVANLPVPKGDLSALSPSSHAALIAFWSAAERALTPDDVNYALARYDEARGLLVAGGVTLSGAGKGFREPSDRVDDRDSSMPRPLGERIARAISTPRANASFRWVYAFVLISLAAFAALQTLYIGAVFGGTLDYVAAVVWGAGGGLLGSDIVAALSAANAAELETEPLVRAEDQGRSKSEPVPKRWFGNPALRRTRRSAK